MKFQSIAKAIFPSRKQEHVSIWLQLCVWFSEENKMAVALILGAVGYQRIHLFGVPDSDTLKSPLGAFRPIWRKESPFSGSAISTTTTTTRELYISRMTVTFDQWPTWMTTSNRQYVQSQQHQSFLYISPYQPDVMPWREKKEEESEYVFYFFGMIDNVL